MTPIKEGAWVPEQRWEITGIISFRFTEETTGNNEMDSTENIKNEIAVVLERLCKEQLIKIEHPDIIVGRAKRI